MNFSHKYSLAKKKEEENFVRLENVLVDLSRKRFPCSKLYNKIQQ